MNRKLVLISILFLIVMLGCAKRAQESSSTPNAEFFVDKLFSHEGCTVYRFTDAGDFVYYTVCDNARPVQTQYNYIRNCGKNCVTDEQLTVPTAYYGSVQES